VHRKLNWLAAPVCPRRGQALTASGTLWQEDDTLLIWRRHKTHPFALHISFKSLSDCIHSPRRLSCSLSSSTFYTYVYKFIHKCTSTVRGERQRQKATLVYNNRGWYYFGGDSCFSVCASAAGLTAASFSTRCAASANTCGMFREIGNGCVGCDERGRPGGRASAVKCTFPPCHSRSGRRKGCGSISTERERELARCGISRQINNLAAPTKNEVNFLSHHAETNRCRLFGESKKGKIYERARIK
jgi:hypothetical protein